MTMIPFTRDLKILTSFVLKYDMAGDLRIAARRAYASMWYPLSQ
jgi:hypothetical protein